MNKNLKFLLVIGLIIVFISLISVLKPKDEKLGRITPGACKIDGYTSSTSPAYLEPTESTTTDSYVTSVNLTCSVSNVEKARLNLDAVASSSAVIKWVTYFSDDGIDWFTEDNATTTPAQNTVHSTLGRFHTWTPTAGSNQRISVPLGDLVSDYVKFNFTVSGASTTLYSYLTKDTD